MIANENGRPFGGEDLELVDRVAQRITGWRQLPPADVRVLRARAVAIIRAIREHEADPPSPVMVLPHLGRIE